MKGSISCMLSATGRLSGARFREPLYITLTSDEEIGYGGAAAVARESRFFREMVAGGTRGIIGRAHHGGSGLCPQGHLRVHRHLPWESSPLQQPRGSSTPTWP